MSSIRNWVRPAAWGVSALLLMTVVQACGGSDSSDEGSGDLPTVRIQVLSGGMSAIGLKAVEESESDEANGFNAEFHYVDGDTANQFFLQKESDVAVGLDPISVALFRNEGYDVSTFYQYQPNYACLVSQSDYSSPEELVGEKVGNTGPDSGTTQSLTVTLDKFFGLSLTEDYSPVEAEPQALVEMLKAGDIEAAGLYEPYTSRAVVEGGAKCLTGIVGDVWEEEVGGSVSYTSLVAFNDWIDENPELAMQVADAMADGTAWLKEDPTRLEEEPFPSMVGTDDTAVLESLEEQIEKGDLYDVAWGPEIIEANTQMLDALAEQGVVIDKVPDGVFRTLGE